MVHSYPLRGFFSSLLALLLLVPSPSYAQELRATIAALRGPGVPLVFSPAALSPSAFTPSFSAASLGPLALATVMAAEVLAGWLILPHFAAIPAGAESKYLMYLCYLIQNLTAFLAAVMTARTFRGS